MYPIQKIPSWQNWSKNVQCNPLAILYPRNEAEVIEIIRQAKAEGRRIRVVGNGHSFSAVNATNQLMLSLEQMQGLISIDEQKEEASCYAGTSINRLNKELFDKGWNIINLGDIDVQSIAGATATGTHGTGRRFGNVSSQITAFTLVTADEEILHCSATENSDLFEAGRVSLGVLGIITQITLKITPAYKLEYVAKKGKLAETLEKLEEYNADNRNFEFYWFPYTKTVQLKFSNETQDKIKDNPTMRYINQHVMENGLLSAFCFIGKKIPISYSILSKLIGWGATSERKINHSHLVYATPRYVRFKEMEYNIPLENFKEAMMRVVEKIHAAHYRVYFPLECRFVKGDDLWLSPAYHRDSAYIAFHVDHRTPHNPYFKDMEAIMMEYDGRPHWGKMHTRQAENLSTTYPMWGTFQQMRMQLDPEGLFMTDYTEGLMGVF